MGEQTQFQFPAMKEQASPQPQKVAGSGDGKGCVRSRLARLLEMLTLFRSGSDWDASALARWFGLSRTRVYNDLALLRDAGIPVIRKRNGYRLADGFLMPPLGLTLDESAALLLQMALPSLVAARDRNLVAATEKLLAGLPPEIRAQTHLLRAHVYFTDGRSRVPPHTTGELLRSILERRRVAISGAPSGDGSGLSAAWSLLDPYGLIHHESSWYVTGYYEAQRQVVTLRVADIWRVEGTPLHFAIPPDFRITDHVPSVPAQGATSSRDSPSTRGSQRLHLPVAVTSP